MGEESAGKAVGHKKYLASTPPREHAEELVRALREALDSLHFAGTELEAQASIPEEDAQMMDDRAARIRTLLAKIEQENTNGKG